jgi:MoxR-like ATPase
VFRRGRETRPLTTLMVVGASNHLPEDEALGALFDRFLVRVGCHNVPEQQLTQVLAAGWELDGRAAGAHAQIHVDQLRQLHGLIRHVEIASLRPQFAELIQRLRRAGLVISDRRAVKLQRLIAASAVLCGRLQANATDFWVLRYIWDAHEEQDILKSLVDQALQAATDEEKLTSHPQSQLSDEPDPEQMANSLEQIASEFERSDTAPVEIARLKDRLGLLAARVQWIKNSQQRSHLEQMTNDLWDRVGAKP